MNRYATGQMIKLGIGVALIAATVLLVTHHRASLPRDPGERRPAVGEEPADRRGASSLAVSVSTPAEVRQVIRSARRAEARDAPKLRRVALASEDPLVAGNALQALGRLGAAAGDPALRALVFDPRLRVRQEAVRALGRSRDRAAVELLIRVIDENPPSRLLAIRALGRIGGAAARRTLEELLSDPASTDADRTFARSALAATREPQAPTNIIRVSPEQQIRDREQAPRTGSRSGHRQ